MDAINQVLKAIEQGDPHAAGQLLPLVYDELRKLAAQRLAHEAPGQTLQATALVHEAYLRLVGGGRQEEWNGRGHFFAAAAEAMRRILVEQARRKQSAKHGGSWKRIELDEAHAPADRAADRLLDLDRVLTRLREVEPASAQLVELRYFAGLTMEQAAAALGLPLRTTERNWTFARTWLHRELSDHAPGEG